LFKIYSFYIFTKEHKQRFDDAFKGQMKMLFGYVREGVNIYSGDERMSTIYPDLKRSATVDTVIDEMAAKVLVKKFKLDSLDEIKNIVKDLDV
jgi:hypothetical protein